MISIVRATANDSYLLSELAKQTFIESHGHSASPEDINSYVNEKYTTNVLEKELSDPRNIYHLVYYNDRPAGYSKIILNLPPKDSEIENIAKLERIYLLEEFYDLHLGSALFKFNIQLIKENNQGGVWLFVWKENQRAFRFYSKNGFTIIGEHDFQISSSHTNPNYVMLLTF
jgi:diamine N-acetyltransferase